MSKRLHGRHAQRDYLPPTAALVCIALGLYFAALCAIIHTLFTVFDVSLSVIGEALK
jgi:hypothetical protein